MVAGLPDRFDIVEGCAQHGVRVAHGLELDDVPRRVDGLDEHLGLLGLDLRVVPWVAPEEARVLVTRLVPLGDALKEDDGASDDRVGQHGEHGGHQMSGVSSDSKGELPGVVWNGFTVLVRLG